MDILRTFRSAAFTGGIAALLLLFGCGGGSSTSGTSTSTSSGGGSTTGSVNLAVTDAPSDNWQQVSVQLESASLVTQGSTTATQVWTASAATPTVVNLVDLSGVATLLGSVPVTAGTYDTLQLTINPSPGTMTLVDANGNTILPANISVQGSPTINVTLAPALVVTANTSTTLQADFDLSDPLSISEVTLNGVEQVTLDLQVRHKPVPAKVQTLQFARKLGKVTAVASSSFTLTDGGGSTFTYEVDSNTLYRDSDTKSAGSLTGLTLGEYALVDSNLNADGTLYARRVWYAASESALPAASPEGLVQSVDPTGGTFTVLAPPSSSAGPASAPPVPWVPQTVTVNASTVWTFATTVSMGTGTSFLSDIWRGCRVDVQLDNTGITASAVNVEAAYDEGFISTVTPSSLTFGIQGAAAPVPTGPAAPTPTSAPPMGATNLAPRSHGYYVNASDPSDSFAWWYFGLPSATDSAPADLVTVVDAGLTEQLPVNGWARLYWDTSSSAWEISNLVLEPEPLSMAAITTAYADGGSGSGTMGVTCLNPLNNFDNTTPTALTITLDDLGDLQTVVSSTDFDGATNVVTVEVPVPESQWATLLVPPATPTASSVNVWVRPVIDGSSIAWHAYSVACFTGTLPPQPAITSFTASSTSITSGSSVTLTPIFTNGTGVINPGKLAATSGTPVPVSPKVTTTYTLSVTDSHGNPVSQSVTVTVGNVAPTITSFTAIPATTIPAGAPVALVGVFTGGKGVITPGSLPAASNMPVPLKPLAAATTPYIYTLTVTNASGTAVTQTVAITVNAPPAGPAISSFTASPTTVAAGGSATLTPDFTGGTGVINPGNLPATASGVSVTVKPKTTTSYTLTVINPAGQKVVSQPVVVTVTPAGSTAN
jgi:hypothetical protein